MTRDTMPELLAPRAGAGELALWTAAAALVVALHLGAIWLLRQAPVSEVAATEAMSAVMVDLAPVAVAPDAVPSETAELLDSVPVESQELPLDSVAADPLPPDVPLPPEPQDTAPLETAELAPLEPDDVEPIEEVEEVEDIAPEMVEVPLPEVAVAVPARRPDRTRPTPEIKPRPVPERPKVERRPPPRPAPAAKASAEDGPVRAAPRPTDGGLSQGVSPARWQSQVVAHINRYKRSLSGQTGLASVRFSIDASGRVTSAALARSSGNSAVDNAAVELVRRASPVPAPPPAMGGGTKTLNVPVNFTR